MKRNFCIGSDWLYFKIYTGVKASDMLLLEKLAPAIAEMKQQKWIEKWFFIRYKDPYEHLRLRFYLPKSEGVAFAIAKIYPILNELMEQDIVWKIQTDTYQREIERYGAATMEASETLFWQDSEMILKYLAIKPLFVNDEMQLLFSFKSIDVFLNSFGLINPEKFQIMNSLQASFKKEFDADKALKKEMDMHYRALSSEINQLLFEKNESHYPEFCAMIQERKNQLCVTVPLIMKCLKLPLFEFLINHIHMMINRQYTSQQRMYECLIYDHLYRYYKMLEHSANP